MSLVQNTLTSSGKNYIAQGFPLNYRVMQYVCVSCMRSNRKFQSNLGKAASPPLRQRMTTPQSPYWLQRDVPHLPTKLLCPFHDHLSHLIYSSLDRPHSPPQTASGSNQPFCHSTFFGHTDRPTEEMDDRHVKIPAHALLIIQRHG